MPTAPTTKLDNAPEHIKLAVDLIQLLESSNIDKAVAIAALEIVLSDLKRAGDN